MQTSVHDRIAAARLALAHAGLDDADAALDAEVLARDALGWDRATLLARGRETEPAGFEERFSSLIERRLAREPVALILGRREFWGLDIAVTPDVLIPRPETELIVEEVLEDARAGCRFSRILDLGTGSGCLAVALAREFPAARVLATDISSAAIQVAKRNAAANGVADAIDFRQTSFFDGVHFSADLIVSNPPYVPETCRDALQPEIRFEPSEALFSGLDGMTAIRTILAGAPRVLAEGGRLIVEFGIGQAPLLREAAAPSGWRVARIRPDLQGVPRVAVLRR